MLSQFGAVAYRRVPLRPFFVGETPPDRREAILVVLSGNKVHNFEYSFWNLGKNDNSQYLAQCINERKIDFAILSEYENLNISYVLHKLNNKYRHIPGMGGCDKITMLALNDIDVHIQREQTRYAMYSVEKDGIDLIIVGTHLQDRRNSDSAQRISTAGRLMNDLENLEKRKQCKKSVIIGDLNANPYDEELLQMNAFHAVLFKDVIKAAETRTIGGIRYRRLYNPILHFLSEDTKTMDLTTIRKKAARLLGIVLIRFLCRKH